jgi:hypothetical protein
MTIEKSKRLLIVDFLDTQVDQVILAQYLKSSTVDAKTQVMSATTGYFSALALAKQPNISRAELELALARSIRELSNQIANITDYYRIFHQIELPSPSLLYGSPSEQTKMLSSIPLEQNRQNSTVVAESILSQEIDQSKNESDDDDDDDDIDWDAPVQSKSGFDMGLG